MLKKIIITLLILTTLVGSLWAMSESVYPGQAVAVTDEAKPVRSAVASDKIFFFLFGMPNKKTLDDVMKEGGIAKVHHIEYNVTNILFGLYMSRDMIVYGE